MSTPPDPGWQHRFVSANGARFHFVEAGDGPLVVLLHGFPEHWWAWRHQLPALAAAGYRAAAIDLRGYGDSDKTPRGYDPLTLGADVAGIVRSLGSRDAVLVGQGWGGFVAWAAAAGHPGHVSALCAVSAPHPRELLGSPFRLITRAPLLHLAAMQLPWIPERRIMRGRYVARHLAAWSAPDNEFPSVDEVTRYRAALAKWPSPHCALEYHRWLFRSRLRADGRAFGRVMRTPVGIPVLQINGTADPAVNSTAVERSRRHVTGAYREVLLDGVGHFAHEESPEVFTKVLLGWLLESARAGVD